MLPIRVKRKLVGEIIRLLVDDWIDSRNPDDLTWNCIKSFHSKNLDDLEEGDYEEITNLVIDKADSI